MNVLLLKIAYFYSPLEVTLFCFLKMSNETPFYDDVKRG